MIFAAVLLVILLAAVGWHLVDPYPRRPARHQRPSRKPLSGDLWLWRQEYLLWEQEQRRQGSL